MRELSAPRTASCGFAASPDRGRAAWVTADGGGTAGDLVVSALDGSGERTVLRNVTCPARGRWTPGAEENTVEGARRNVSFHHDLSNEMFAMFLDETTTYSSALFAG
ncbi:MAG TPA: class I SAM-dependent methyltransferase, partial [Actinoplanes sp.]